jgi:hypothetical protein
MTDGRVLVLQDKSTFLYEREQPELIGYASNTLTAAERRGRTKASPQCGMLMHSSLAVTTEGLSLALTHQILEPEGVQKLRYVEAQN